MSSVSKRAPSPTSEEVAHKRPRSSNEGAAAVSCLTSASELAPPAASPPKKDPVLAPPRPPPGNSDAAPVSSRARQEASQTDASSRSTLQFGPERAPVSTRATPVDSKPVPTFPPAPPADPDSASYAPKPADSVKTKVSQSHESVVAPSASQTPTTTNGSTRPDASSLGPADVITARPETSSAWPGYSKELSKEWAEKPWGIDLCLGADVPDRAQVDCNIACRQKRRKEAFALRERRKADAAAAGVPPPTVPVEGCSSLKHYDLSERLGEGTFGVVVRGKHRLTDKPVALKKLTVHDAKEGLALTSIREIKFLKCLRHPSIVPIIDMVYAPRVVPSNGSQAAKDDTGEIYMVEPYMDNDLAGLLRHVRFTVPQIKLYIKQFLEGVAFLHANNIVHRDIKSANLLINNEGQLQIADFGLARALHNPVFVGQDRVEYTGTVVTRWYRPPELLAGDRFYGPEIDLWGVGCILAEMFLREPLFMGNSEVHQLQLIAQRCGSPNERTIPGWNSFPGVRNADINGRIEDADLPGGMLDFGSHPRTLKQWLTLDGPVQIPPKAADLIDGLLQLNPALRTPASQAIDHDWLWSNPLPANPASLPKYPSKKDLDRQHQTSRPNSVVQPIMPQQPVQVSSRFGPPAPIGSGRPRGGLPPNPHLPPRPVGYPAPPGPRRSGPGAYR